MRTLDASVAERLGKLIPRLATMHDGEVVATVRVIGRMLVSIGADWHDLAEAVTKPSAPVVVYRERPPASWHEVARWCRDNDRGRLNPKERQFILDMAGRLVCGGEPTERQAAWLRSLYARLGAGA